ncbi:MAG TPA: FeoA family protein [Lacunisphaera sp.]|nr:FeoA family protein [Lacunisphaera sp.]
MPLNRDQFTPLCQLPPGCTGRICVIKGDDGFALRLREMGFGEAALVTKISGHKTSLCQVNGTRIALNHGAAMAILVEPLPHALGGAGAIASA